MANLETLNDVLATEQDTVTQMSVVPLATRMQMASDDDKLARPNYVHLDDALRMSYDDIMSKQTDTQLAFKRQAESSTTSETGEIVRSTVENYIVNALNKPEKAVLSIGNIMTATGSTIGRDWANWARESINDYSEANMSSQKAGDVETWAAKGTGGIMSALEFMALGLISKPLTYASMGTDILGDATMNDIDRYIAETGDINLQNYKAKLKDVGINALNVGIQTYIEDKLGFGRILNLKTAGASEFLAGFLQEFFQGTLDDIAESAKGNQEWKAVWNGMLSNVKDGVVGALLQGSLGLAAHHHYASVAERQMSDFFQKNGMDKKQADQKAHDLRLRLENEVAPLAIKQDKEIYDLVGQKGAVWGSVYDVAYNGVRLTDQTGMSEAELDSMATEVANRLATQVLESVVKNGTDLSDVRIGFNPVDQSVYVNDKKTLDIKQAVKEIEELNAEPAATKEDVKKAIAEEKKAEEKKVAETQQPKSAVDPKAPFNKTKEKSPAFKQLQLGLQDGSIKLSQAEQIRYNMLLRDKFDKAPTTNAQMDLFAEKMVQKYAPSVEIAPAQKAPVQPQTEVKKPNKYDTGVKKASKMSESLKQKAPAGLVADIVKEMDDEYNQRMTKEAVIDAVNFALSSEENMETAIDAVLNMKEVDGIRPFEMYSALMLIATKYNHPLLFEQLRMSPIHQGLATQQGQNISALQFTTERGMINVMKVVDSLERNALSEENKEAVAKNQKELAATLESIEYTNEETTEAIEDLEC